MPKNKDPEKPKGRSSAYAFFVAKERKEKKLRNEQVEFVVFSQECSQKWKDMDDDERKPFQKLAEQDKARYDDEMAHYVPPPSEKGKRSKKKSKKDKDPNLPKRGKSAFFMFSGEHRAGIKEKNPGATVGEIAKQLGDAWGRMSPAQKQPYEVLAEKDRQRYKREMEEYRKRGSGASGGNDEDEDDDEEESDE